MGSGAWKCAAVVNVANDPETGNEAEGKKTVERELNSGGCGCANGISRMEKSGSEQEGEGKEEGEQQVQPSLQAGRLEPTMQYLDNEGDRQHAQHGTGARLFPEDGAPVDDFSPQTDEGRQGEKAKTDAAERGEPVLHAFVLCDQEDEAENAGNRQLQHPRPSESHVEVDNFDAGAECLLNGSQPEHQPYDRNDSSQDGNRNSGVRDVFTRVVLCRRHDCSLGVNSLKKARFSLINANIESIRLCINNTEPGYKVSTSHFSK